MTDVAVLVGSLRRGSYSRKLAHALVPLTPDSLSLKIIDGLGDLPLYNQDLDAEHQPPQAWADFRQAVAATDALLFVTPEYNRSLPGVLKNAIDVGSRPYGSSVWSGKPGAVISNSPGAISGFGANHHLRQSMVFLAVPMMQQPEAYFGGVDKWFDDDGKLSNASAEQFLAKFMQAFAAWVKRFT